MPERDQDPDPLLQLLEKNEHSAAELLDVMEDSLFALLSDI